MATLLTCIGAAGRKVYEASGLVKEDANDIEKVLTMISTYVTPLTNIPYERCVFNSRQQKSNETFLQYVTEIKRLGDKCELTQITVDQILRDRILLGLRDENLRKRILKDNKLTLQTLIQRAKQKK